MADCLIGGLTNEEARKALISYFQSAYNLAWYVVYPNKEPPALEDRKNPFILLSIVEIKREQEYIGSSEYIISKFLSIEFWTREYSGMKNTSLFTDFVDSLGLKTVAGIAYKTPDYMTPKIFKGWEITPAALPFEF